MFENKHTPFIVHRLDKNTTGVLLLARRDSIARKLSFLFSSCGTIKKQYFAVVEAPSSWDEHMVSSVYTSSSIRPRFPLTNDQADGKPCITDYRILAISSFCSKKIALVSLRPITGRTHQLRIHCAKELNAPILGDYLYQGNLNLSRAITGLCCTSAAGKVGLPSGPFYFPHCFKEAPHCVWMRLFPTTF
ncbi:hypothetical protein MDAP_001643 [Mitosporidium daphniae]